MLLGHRGLWVVAVVVVGAVGRDAVAEEGYAVDVASALVVDDAGGIAQSWSATCVATDAAADARITVSGKDLRFVAARDEVLAVSVDDSAFAVDAVAAGGYDYDAALVAGAHVFARFAARCGSDDVFADAVVDTAPVVLPPLLSAPFAVRRTDTFETVSLSAIPAGVEVELVDVAVQARPRGEERVVVSVRTSFVEVARVELGAADFDVGGRALVSPAFVATAGALQIDASFEGASAVAIDGEVVPVDIVAEGEGEGEGDVDVGGGCSAGGGDKAVLSTMLVALLVRRRRR
jgi:hypothetical protein